MQPKISTVIPSFNKAKYIRQTLDSIFLQKYPNLEVIIQDGGSTDGTLKIIKAFAKKYPKEIKWESKKDKGQLDAINKGLSKASGEILAYINADDVYTKEAFCEVAKAYKKNPNVLWFAGRGRIINAKGKEIAKFVTSYKNLFLAFNSFFFLLIVNYLMQPSVFISRKAYKKYGPFTGMKRAVMEYDLWLKLARVSMPVVFDKYLTGFRMSGENISTRYFLEILEADGEIAKKYTNSNVILILHKLHNILRKVWGANLH